MQKVKILSVTVLLVALMTGCATKPKAVIFDPVACIVAEYDAVWGAVVEYFAIGSLPIDTIEKDSGLIVTSWMNAGKDQYGGGEYKVFCDCGGAGLAIKKWTQGKFNIFVKTLPDGRCDVRVTCSYQQGRDLGGSLSVVNCESSGYLEKQIHEYVRAKVLGSQLPEVPTFLPSSKM